MLLRFSVRRHVFQPSLRQKKNSKDSISTQISSLHHGTTCLGGWRSDADRTGCPKAARCVPPAQQDQGVGATHERLEQQISQRPAPSFHGQLNGSSPPYPQGKCLIWQSSADGNRDCKSPLRAKINEASGVYPLDVESSKASGFFLMG